jgi:hypothetical protein
VQAPLDLERNEGCAYAIRRAMTLDGWRKGLAVSAQREELPEGAHVRRIQVGPHLLGQVGERSGVPMPVRTATAIAPTSCAIGTSSGGSSPTTASSSAANPR